MKIKKWAVSVLGSKRVLPKHDSDFFTVDTDASLIVEFDDEEFNPSTATVTIYNNEDLSLVSEDWEVVDNELGFPLVNEDRNIVEHGGNWTFQVVFIQDGLKYASRYISFYVKDSLFNEELPRLEIVEDWETIKGQVEEVIESEVARIAGETERATREVMRINNELERVDNENRRKALHAELVELKGALEKEIADFKVLSTEAIETLERLSGESIIEFEAIATDKLNKFDTDSKESITDFETTSTTEINQFITDSEKAVADLVAEIERVEELYSEELNLLADELDLKANEKDIPIRNSQLENDSGYITKEEVPDVDVSTLATKDELNLKANKQQENWVKPTVGGNWKPHGDSAGIQYIKDEFGFVHLQGTVQGGWDYNLFRLPEGYRPNEVLTFPIPTSNQTGLRAITILPAGQFYITGGMDPVKGQCSVNGITFKV